MIEHVISRNCRAIYKGHDYPSMASAWARVKADCKPGDVCRWDHESIERDDFAPDPHCGLVTIPAVFSGATVVHEQKYVLTVARYERGKGGRIKGMGSPKVGAR